jgi:GT2 family glycosyltransferase
MKLSIIIVNYNVKYFLRQLLQSIQASAVDFSYEIIIVDNASTDGSVSFIEKEFPSLTLIRNETNVGFSRANNIGIRQSKGAFILLLNPDTVLQEDTLQKTVTYLDLHPEAGALGCRMIDGSGHFLPESKRGFPSPRVALFKSLGLSALFPASRYFNEYYLGHLPEFEINEVDVLTGAFMLLRRDVLDKSGLLDEDFFMYGEDIDLSYRIKQVGYSLLYYPETTIIHFKGESTQKDSVAYIRRFYGAMQIFARKHYPGRQVMWLRLFLQMGIVLRAMLAMSGQLLKRFGPAAVEWVCIAGSLKFFSQIWARFYYHDPHYYDLSGINWNIVLYTSIWTISLLLSGAYDQLFRWRRVLRGVLLGWVAVAAVYGFLGESFRPSRSLVLGAGPIVAATVFSLRALFHRIARKRWPLQEPELKKYIVVGHPEQAEKIRRLLKSYGHPMTYAGLVTNHNPGQNDEGYLGDLEHLDQIVRFHQVREVIFCSDGLPSSEIMRWMTRLGAALQYKIAPQQPMGIIGSSSRNSSGELYTFDIRYNLGENYLRRNKRLFDAAASLVCLILSPLLIFRIEQKWGFFRNLAAVLSGKKTWVSYGSANAGIFFPALKPGILSPAVVLYREDEEQAQTDADYFYARDYSVWKDLSLMVNNIGKLGD